MLYPSRDFKQETPEQNVYPLVQPIMEKKKKKKKILLSCRDGYWTNHIEGANGE